MNTEIIEFVENQAVIALKYVDKFGYIPGGKNGPYNDNETPVRNSSHWIQIFSWLYSKNSKYEYYDAIKKLSDYLYNYGIEKTFYSFCCRNKDGKDHVNGTIGQAWVIEGLVKASIILKNDKYYNLAVKMFLNHEFNEKLGCWNRKEITGEVLGYDGTFNHQLWFAASGAEIIMYKDNDIIRKQIQIFLDKCMGKYLFRVRKNGTICHYSCINSNLYNTLYFYARELKNLIKYILNKPNMQYKEEGYHYFALYGFAILKKSFPTHKIFKSKKINLAISYAKNKENYLRQLDINPYKDGTGLAKKIGGKLNIYCFPYNSPVYELPYIYKMLITEDDIDDMVNKLWNLHKEYFMDEGRNISKNTNDEVTLTARIYELLREN